MCVLKARFRGACGRISDTLFVKNYDGGQNMSRKRHWIGLIVLMGCGMAACNSYPAPEEACKMVYGKSYRENLSKPPPITYPQGLQPGGYIPSYEGCRDMYQENRAVLEARWHWFWMSFKVVGYLFVAWICLLSVLWGIQSIRAAVLAKIRKGHQKPLPS